ncbi:NAD(P)H-dependent oxidoreductase [Candidatus Dojkabacteria bacterium]|nr:NAD(P)H-dependent oxidoreductase [Candidatus Dojkabacteria bacterium]
MSTKLNIPIIIGTSRPSRMSEKVAKFVKSVADKNVEIETTLVDPKDFNLPEDGGARNYSDPKYVELIKNADALLIIVPEYNHSFPGSLKRLLDSEKDGYKNKAVAFAGVSVGPWGGVRAIEQLALSVRWLGLHSITNDVHFPDVNNLFDDKDEIKDREVQEKRVNETLTELIWMAKTLKWGRENVK